jgi:hypothetical protein
MPRKSKYRLALPILFSSEKGLEEAITIFNSWCQTKLPKKVVKKPSKKVTISPKTSYGFIKTDTFTGELFFISPEHFEGWKLFLLIRDLEVNGLISVGSFKCPKIVVHRKPAS